MISIAICDDEEKILSDMKSKIKHAFDTKNAETEIYSTSSPKELLGYLEMNRPDVLFLDIDMPQISGMDVAEKMLNEGFDTLLIFVTNHDALVYKSFRYHPFGFIRKSYFDNVLEEQIENVIGELSKRNNTFSFKTNAGIYRLKLSQILYFESEANYVNLHTVDENYRFRGTLTALESELAMNGFIRTHKGFLVNQEHIYSIHADDISMSDGSVLPISRINKEAVKAKIMKYMR